jgi:uncharacterized protein
MTPKALRPVYAVFGIVCVAVGFVGLVTPVMPGTVFFVIALWAFRNSSEKLEKWLLNNRFVGPTLRDWDENRAMKPRTKVIAIVSVWVAIPFTCVYIWRKPPILIKQIDWIMPKLIPIGLLAITLVWLTW